MILKDNFFLFFLIGLSANLGYAQPDWPGIKSNASFTVLDEGYAMPYLLDINVGGWEDGLYMTRDGNYLFSTYLPLDAFSWINDLILDPFCFDFHPYYRGPLLGIDTITNIFGCEKFMQSDIVIAQRMEGSLAFNTWSASNMQESFSFDGGAQGVLLNADTFDLFVFTKDGIGTMNTDIMLMRNVPVNPFSETAVPIFATEEQEDNPHIERLNDSTLVLFFDRERFIYYAMSYDNGELWTEPILIPTVLNDQAPYDVQPHLWNDGENWWVYFCANNDSDLRCIFRSKQMLADDWENWDTPELIIAPNFDIPGYGTVFGVGEPTVSEWGDLSFVVVYGDVSSGDSTDVFDCDPWFMPRIDSPLSGIKEEANAHLLPRIYPNPVNDQLTLDFRTNEVEEVEVVCYSVLGEVMFKRIVSDELNCIDCTDLVSGMYFLQVDANSPYLLKFIKN